ncbi:hypothetical protein BVRB_5g109070 [Beta vulgaris subsp. vulgaris]|nr:hypothetical protein BVRB_5g109070 [Beta vulgaris subsp. vulgaris]
MWWLGARQHGAAEAPQRGDGFEGGWATAGDAAGLREGKGGLAVGAAWLARLGGLSGGFFPVVVRWSGGEEKQRRLLMVVLNFILNFQNQKSEIREERNELKQTF